MKQEIERKYAIKYLPEDLKIEKVINIKQCTIYNDGITMARLRKISTQNKDSNRDVEYIYTVKVKGLTESKKENNVAQRYEIENNISEEKYLELLERQINNTINKTRIISPIGNDLKAEIDIYYDYLEGLLTLEVEFENSVIAEKFEKPDWFGEEIGYKELSNGKLSRMTKEQFRSKVSKEFMDNNRKIIEQLKNNNVINFKKYK